MKPVALHASRVLTPEGFQPATCVLVDGQKIAAVVPSDECSSQLPQRVLPGTLLPGFIDLQVNGGGGVLFNDCPTVEGIAAIGEAHRRFGTTGFLPTFSATIWRLSPERSARSMRRSSRGFLACWHPHRGPIP